MGALAQMTPTFTSVARQAALGTMASIDRQRRSALFALILDEDDGDGEADM